MKTKELVLVTGGSGYIAVNIILKLLKKGYGVRTTLRTISRQEEIKSMLKVGGVLDFSNLEFIKADLTKDENWFEATNGTSYVIHVASPTPATRPSDGDLMVKMAVQGTLRVMKAAKEANVKRIVMTSASGAVLSGHKYHPSKFTEKDWTNLDGNIDPYQRSKTMAEQAAWNFAKENKMELTTILPVSVLGPIMGKDYSHSNQIIKSMLIGQLPLLMKMKFDHVDVRDVADLHLLAMTSPKAVGERFLATTGENITYKEIAQLLRNNLGDKANKVSTRVMPNFFLKFLAIFIKDLRMPATFLGQNTACSNAKAIELLGWHPRPACEAILSTAQDMIKLNIL